MQRLNASWQFQIVVAEIKGEEAPPRLMTTMLVGVKPTDPLKFVSMMVVFLAIATASSWVPANRAAGVDPNKALREE